MENYLALKRFIEQDLAKHHLGTGLTDFDYQALLKGEVVEARTTSTVDTIVTIGLSTVKVDVENKLDEYPLDFENAEVTIVYSK